MQCSDVELTFEDGTPILTANVQVVGAFLDTSTLTAGFPTGEINSVAEINLWDRASGNLLENVVGINSAAAITGRTLSPGDYILGVSEATFEGRDGITVRNGENMLEAADGSTSVLFFAPGLPQAQLGLSTGGVVIEAALFCFSVE